MSVQVRAFVYVCERAGFRFTRGELLSSFSLGLSWVAAEFLLGC